MPCCFPLDFLPVFTVSACAAVLWWAMRHHGATHRSHHGDGSSDVCHRQNSFLYGYWRQLGLLGSIMTFTPYMRGVINLAASLFVIIYGLKMLDVFPALRRFTLRLPRFVVRKAYRMSCVIERSPLVIGLVERLHAGLRPVTSHVYHGRRHRQPAGRAPRCCSSLAWVPLCRS